MSEMQRSIPEEAREWVERLKKAVTPQERIQAASELRAAAVRTRGPAPTRGALTHAGEPLLFSRDLADVLRELRNQPAGVRREVAFALGEVGGEDMVAPLAELGKDPDSSVRLIAADALGRIGGPKAVEELIRLAQNDPSEDVRALAIESLGVLAIQECKVAVRTRGAVKVTGPTPPQEEKVGLDVESLSQALERIAQEDRSSYVRDTVLDILAALRARM
jgi:phosphoglycolate phosphatase-like HAD superfamily hydrolase